MPSRRHFLAASTATLVTLGAPALAQGGAARMRSVTAITQVFGDGIRLTAAAIEYTVAIDGAKLQGSAFQVAGRRITDAYTSTAADPAQRAQAGSFVILALSPEDADAILAEHVQPQRGAHSQAADAGGPGPLGGPPVGGSDTVYRSASVQVAQVAPILASDGSIILPDGKTLTSSAVKNLVVDDFKQLEFHDPVTGDTLRYNLFIPRAYAAGKAYPLVLFMHDAGATSENTRTTLLQGRGAVVWASPEDQEKRPCFVLAPQYASLIANDNSETTSLLDTTVHLVQALSRQYGLDTRRLYATGQSGGCMQAIAMNIRYPQLFAASYLVAGQWDAALVKPLARKKLWILVSQDDAKAYPGQNAITAVLEQEGARIGRAIWDGTWTPAQFRAAYDRLHADANQINYVALRKGTVIPPGQSAAGASGHRNTWRIAYDIAPIREWLFRQVA